MCFCVYLEQDRSVCFGIKPVAQVANEIKFTEIYAVELVNNGSTHNKSNVTGPTMHSTKHVLGHDSQVCSCNAALMYSSIMMIFTSVKCCV